MKTPRLDWMKFNIYDFVHSEDVEAMSAEEVGQYILLMAAAWVGGKDCTLPNDEGYLARKARGTVSAKVMKKFTQTTEGRLVNEVQREIWLEQQGMWNAASEAGKRGRAKQLGKTPEPSSGGGQRIGPAESGDAPGDKMRCDEIRKERSNVAAASTSSSIPHDSSFSSGNSSASGNSPAPAPSNPVPTFLPTRFENPGYLVWDILSDDAKLANIFYDNLPPENQKAAPVQWERLWSEDLAEITDGWELVRDVLLHASRKKDKEGVRIYVRMSSVIENYDKLKTEVVKLRKKGQSTKEAPPIASAPSNGKFLTAEVAQELLTQGEQSD